MAPDAAAAIMYSLKPGRVYRVTHPTPFFTDSWRMLAVDEVVLVFRMSAFPFCCLLNSDGLVGSAYVDVLRNNCSSLAPEGDQ